MKIMIDNIGRERNREMEKKRTKVLAMYLPQYHEIPENNEWWGKGFTEWSNVKKATPLFDGHYQPRVPLNENYYDLSEPSTMQEQMKMAKEYGVDGFCIYHYWFNGKKILEKPVEQLLKLEKAELPYCFCWANEPWTRTWDGLEGAKQMLLSQEYGNEDDWFNHYYYLAEFFKREEYIKVENKPVFAIYKETDIEGCDKMLELWNSLAIEDGFAGIYVICTRRENTFSNKVWGDAFFDFEPFATVCSMTKQQREFAGNYHYGNRTDNDDLSYFVYDCEKICKEMVKRFVLKNGKHYLGMFVGWDNTARRGIDTTGLYENMTPEVFGKYFKIQYKKSLELNNEFMFINAWNEWGEGTYLEPDEKYGYKFLEAIKAGKEIE